MLKTDRKQAFFLDQKYNRQAVARIAKGKHVLDCFTHTGAFLGLMQLQFAVLLPNARRVKALLRRKYTRWPPNGLALLPKMALQTLLKGGNEHVKSNNSLLDSFGIGHAADAERFGDKGADTLGHICSWMAETVK